MAWKRREGLWRAEVVLGIRTTAWEATTSQAVAHPGEVRDHGGEEALVRCEKRLSRPLRRGP